MKVDGEKVLYQKIGVTIRELALSLLSKNVGDRIQSISRYQEEFQVSRGTIQNAICYLKEVRAVELVSCGHLGTFIEKIDYEKLQECCLTQGLMGIMPLPYSLIYEGMATAMYEQLKDLRFNMAYVRGAIGRIELVESGAYHFAIGSQFAVEHEIQCGREIEAVFNFGVGSYLSKHVLLLRDHGKNGITEGMRVAYDSESLDQSCLTTNIVKGKKVELVNMRTQQTITALLDGNIDAGVWNYDDVLENHCLDDLKVVFLTESEYNEKFSTAVMVIRKNNKYLKKILEKNISVSKTLEILSDVCKGKKHPYY